MGRNETGMERKEEYANTNRRERDRDAGGE
jgi:hypothetical protein